ETKEVEESAEANTFGSILHLSLERLYQPFTGRVVSAAELKTALPTIEATVNGSFNFFFDNNEPGGKSLLQQEVIKVYVKKLVNNDIRFIDRLGEQNHFLTLHDLEREFSAPLEITLGEKSTLIYIKGKIDRIDSFMGKTRIIDYKSSVKNTDKFIFENFEKLFHDKNYDKQLQLMLYAWLLYKNGFNSPEKIQPCIFPFKTFTEEPKYIVGASKKPFVFSEDFLKSFEHELKLFIETIFDTAMPFGQTSDDESHKYCPYNSICNFAV
ncbi:MAG TPA: PD-(D/E)XK nuclease family protein, partial [Bacteroidia bacterium]|nr:PD-(D/E)XK nuclease family protein [Bacteroidia bacterium]